MKWLIAGIVLIMMAVLSLVNFSIIWAHIHNLRYIADLTDWYGSAERIVDIIALSILIICGLFALRWIVSVKK